jgi:DNA-directed RNA polymerase specialized sigma24 family protein
VSQLWSLRTAIARRFRSIDDIETPLFSRHPRPEDIVLEQEMLGQVSAALDELRQNTSPRTYQIFFRRFIDGQSAADVAASFGMTPEAVHVRYSRVMRLWRELTRSRALPVLLQ